MTKKIVLLGVMLIASQATITNTYASSVNAAEFSSMQQCLASISSKTGEKLQVMSDKPNKVFGVLSQSKKTFACEQKVTGSKGTYYYGYYMD